MIRISWSRLLTAAESAHRPAARPSRSEGRLDSRLRHGLLLAGVLTLVLLIGAAGGRPAPVAAQIPPTSVTGTQQR